MKKENSVARARARVAIRVARALVARAKEDGWEFALPPVLAAAIAAEEAAEKSRREVADHAAGQREAVAVARDRLESARITEREARAAARATRIRVEGAVRKAAPYLPHALREEKVLSAPAMKRAQEAVKDAAAAVKAAVKELRSIAGAGAEVIERALDGLRECREARAVTRARLESEVTDSTVRDLRSLFYKSERKARRAAEKAARAAEAQRLRDLLAEAHLREEAIRAARDGRFEPIRKDRLRDLGDSRSSAARRESERKLFTFRRSARAAEKEWLAEWRAIVREQEAAAEAAIAALE